MVSFDDYSDEVSEERVKHLKHFSPFYRVLAFFAALCLILLSLQGYFYLIHPSPKMNVVLADVQSFISKDLRDPFSSHRPDEISAVLSENENAIKQIANFIAARSCPSGDLVCQTKALFYFVRDQITYVPDAQFHDQLENPLAVLKTGGADCEDMAVLVGALQKAIGNEARLVFIPGHAYAQVKIPGYWNKWYNLETTCKTCKFNDVPTENLIQPKEFLPL